MKSLITILLVFVTVSSYSQISTIKVQGVDTAAMLNPYKFNYPRQAISLTTTGTSGAATYSNSTGVFNIPNYSSGKFTPTIVPYAGVDSILTQDAGGLFYDGADLNVGHNNPSVYSGFIINGGRASIQAALGGMLLNVGSGFTPGTYDASKHYTFQNRGNTYLDMYSTGTGPWVHHADFATNVSVSQSLNVGVVGDYADNAAAITAGLSVGTIYRTGDALKIVH